MSKLASPRLHLYSSCTSHLPIYNFVLLHIAKAKCNKTFSYYKPLKLLAQELRGVHTKNSNPQNNMKINPLNHPIKINLGQSLIPKSKQREKRENKNRLTNLISKREKNKQTRPSLNINWHSLIKKTYMHH